MSNLMIRDLAQSRELDRQAMSAVRGGAAGVKGIFPVANVNVDVNQNIVQVQDIRVNALNNVGVIGAGFGPLSLDINPSQWASNKVAL